MNERVDDWYFFLNGTGPPPSDPLANLVTFLLERGWTWREYCETPRIIIQEISARMRAQNRMGRKAGL